MSDGRRTPWWWRACVLGGVLVTAVGPVRHGVTTAFEHAWWSTSSTATNVYTFPADTPAVGAILVEPDARLFHQPAGRTEHPTLTVQRRCLVARPVVFRDGHRLTARDRTAFPGGATALAVQIEAPPAWAGCRTAATWRLPPQTGTVDVMDGVQFSVWPQDRRDATDAPPAP